VLTNQLKHHRVCPPKLIYDQAAGFGKIIADAYKASTGLTRLVARLVKNQRHSEGFAPEEFKLSDDNKTLTCPNGKSTHTTHNYSVTDGRRFCFLASQCRDCPLRKKCGPLDKYDRRYVFISDYRDFTLQALNYQKTEEFKQDMKLRPIIERHIACLVRYNDARRCRFRGCHKSDFQQKMCASAYNLKQWCHVPA